MACLSGAAVKDDDETEENYLSYDEMTEKVSGLDARIGLFVDDCEVTFGLVNGICVGHPEDALD